jgi:hypothetical protein
MYAIYQINTCSFCSVSSLSEAESVSRVSPLRAGGGLFVVGPFTEGRRVTDEFKEEETRGALAAERAVAPFVIEFVGEIEADEEVRRDEGVVDRPGEDAVVAMIPRIRYNIVMRSYVKTRIGWQLRGQLNATDALVGHATTSYSRNSSRRDFPRVVHSYTKEY